MKFALYRHDRTEGNEWVFKHTYCVATKSQAFRICLDRGWFNKAIDDEPQPEIRMPIPA